MKNMRPWIRFGCFLTGYNFNIIKSSSEASVKEVKKNTSALLIVIILWGTIGYLFSDRYMHMEALGASIVALVAVVIVVQIERQIILDISNKWGWGKSFRVVIGFVMAFIGSVIIDQIIFKDDIEIGKKEYIVEKIKTILPSKLQDINNEIQRNDSLIESKNLELTKLIDEIDKKPSINMPTREKTEKPGKYKAYVSGENGKPIEIEKDTTYITYKTKTESIPNFKIDFIPGKREQIKELSGRRDTLFSEMRDIRKKLEKELNEKTGFLTELDIMKKILFESWVSILFWSLWFIFFCAIELFVLVNKLSKKEETDYDMVIRHERDSKIKAIEQLSVKP